jgi:hypothetical protein
VQFFTQNRDVRMLSKWEGVSRLAPFFAKSGHITTLECIGHANSRLPINRIPGHCGWRLPSGCVYCKYNIPGGCDRMMRHSAFTRLCSFSIPSIRTEDSPNENPRNMKLSIRKNRWSSMDYSIISSTGRSNCSSTFSSSMPRTAPERVIR